MTQTLQIVPDRFTQFNLTLHNLSSIMDNKVVLSIGDKHYHSLEIPAHSVMNDGSASVVVSFRRGLQS